MEKREQDWANQDERHGISDKVGGRFDRGSADESGRNGTRALRINKTQTTHFFETIMAGLDIPESMRYKFPSQ